MLRALAAPGRPVTVRAGDGRLAGTATLGLRRNVDQPRRRRWSVICWRDSSDGARRAGVIVDVPPAEIRERLAEAMAIYVAAMGYAPISGSQRGAHVLRHAEFEAFRCRAALNSHGR